MNERLFGATIRLDGILFNAVVVDPHQDRGVRVWSVRKFPQDVAGGFLTAVVELDSGDPVEAIRAAIAQELWI